jgi:hypothetical protein
MDFVRDSPRLPTSCNVLLRKKIFKINDRQENSCINLNVKLFTNK